MEETGGNVSYQPNAQISTPCTQSLHLAFLARLADVGFPAGIDGGPVATKDPSTVFAWIPDGRPSTKYGMRLDMVMVNHEAPSIPPVLVEGGYDGRGFVEVLAPSALAPLDATILGTARLDDLHGHVALLEEFLEGAVKLGAVVGLNPRMTTGNVLKMRSKAVRMLRAEGVVTSSAAVSLKTGSQTVS